MPVMRCSMQGVCPRLKLVLIDEVDSVEHVLVAAMAELVI